MESFSWVGSAVSALAGIVNPWLTVYGFTVVLLIVIVVSLRDIKIAEINSNPTAKPVKHSGKRNKKNR